MVLAVEEYLSLTYRIVESLHNRRACGMVGLNLVKVWSVARGVGDVHVRGVWDRAGESDVPDKVLRHRLANHRVEALKQKDELLQAPDVPETGVGTKTNRVLNELTRGHC